MPLEVERKYLNVDFATLRRALHDLGARNLGAHFESNWVFDTPDAQLFASGRLLRLRLQEWPDVTRHVLTLKLPAPQNGQFKVREERELEVADGAAMRSVLKGLGYAVGARYEKVREPWFFEDVEVELDALPFADVVELEGEAGHIDRVAARLGLDKAEISTKSYHQLHQEWRRLHNLPPDLSFVFDAEQRRRCRRELGLADTEPRGGKSGTAAKA
ncbi:MAG: class IV adenylate cyclase [Desulfovibrio sp.]|uniref:class IV adenylate cyclase n=1 Tax=Desulfovibrio sp. TaxID=885 RepID=UPI002588067E|nr:class IV adenylate cyclase [Desulfovibrio sp.]MCD7984898.1 class IV adenylate cyclase [Desulfovibrio sp.]